MLPLRVAEPLAAAPRTHLRGTGAVVAAVEAAAIFQESGSEMVRGRDLLLLICYAEITGEDGTGDNDLCFSKLADKLRCGIPSPPPPIIPTAVRPISLMLLSPK